MWKERAFGIQSYFVYCVSFSAFLGFIPFLISGYLACPVLPVSSLTLYEFACSVWYNCLLLWEEMTFDLLYTYADCTPFTDSSHLWNVHLWDISEWNHIFPLTFFNLVYLIHCHFVSVCVCVCVCVFMYVHYRWYKLGWKDQVSCPRLIAELQYKPVSLPSDQSFM